MSYKNDVINVKIENGYMANYSMDSCYHRWRTPPTIPSTDLYMWVQI